MHNYDKYLIDKLLFMLIFDFLDSTCYDAHTFLNWFLISDGYLAYSSYAFFDKLRVNFANILFELF